MEKLKTTYSAQPEFPIKCKEDPYSAITDFIRIILQYQQDQTNKINEIIDVITKLERKNEKR